MSPVTMAGNSDAARLHQPCEGPMIAQFALRLLCGISLTWLMLPRSQITPGFFRIQSLLALALGALAAITVGMPVFGTGAEAPLLPLFAARAGRLMAAALAY